MRHGAILEILRELIGPAIRFDTSKLNMKSPGYGAAVEWHQDWAFYPHTNSDLCAVGVMMDDCGIENGPLLCIPGSHRGPRPRPPRRRRLLRRDRSRRKRARLLAGRTMHRQGWQHLDSPRAHHSRLGGEHVGEAAAAPALSIRGGRRLAPRRHASAQGLGRMAGADRLRSVRSRCAAGDGGAGAAAAAPREVRGLDLRDAAGARTQLFRSAGARVPDRGPLIRASRGTAGGRRALSSRSDGDA